MEEAVKRRCEGGADYKVGRNREIVSYYSMKRQIVDTKVDVLGQK